MKKVSKSEAIRLFKAGIKIYSIRRVDRRLGRIFNPKSPDIQGLIDRDGRRFEFSIDVS